MNQPASIFDKQIPPYYQAMIVFAGVLAVDLGSKLVKWTGLLEVPDRFPWITAASFMLVFAIFNSVFSLTSKSMAKYWGQSVYSFLGLAFLSGLAAYLFSSMSIDEAGSYRWIFFVVTFGYLVFLALMAMIRQIVEFAQREEWHHPRIRQNKRKR
ncbi:MAG TPA: hypothetical protein PKA00_16475 [Saprospiraceae bacterium]|nr:hypothetical protein [Saprospiraceae bacterium]HMQ84512.1 hypothetical protein [Saprospiraceae bacterium]